MITIDLFLQGLEIVFRVGLAILQMNQTELIQLDMEGMLQVYHHNLHVTCHLSSSSSGAKYAEPPREEPPPLPDNWYMCPPVWYQCTC